MKLIDILVEELPKRGGWPKRANCITQDGDLKVEPAYCHPSVAKCDDDGFWFLDSSRIGGFRVDTLASDYTTAIITREQYEAALAEKEHPLPWDEKNKPCPTLGAECRGCPDCGRRVSCTSDDITDDAVRAEMGMNSRDLDAALAAKNDGWIDWGGGDCPVDGREMVDVIFGHGGRMSTNIADCWCWSHDGTNSDIIAYRLHKPQEAEQAKADDEADLNECIGQDAAPVWNGEGLPPVGCECEFISNDTSWGAVVVIGMDGDKVVIKPSGETYYGITPSEKQVFRPIRSEADRKRDESMRVIYEILDAGTSTKQDAADIYDAIAAGKIPGVKLED